MMNSYAWYLGPAVGRYPIKFILPEFVSYLGKRGVLCVGNGWYFCTPILMDMCNITFEVPRFSTFVLKKSSEKKIFTIIFVVKSLKGFSWNNNGPASQTVAQHYFTIGPMYRVARVVAFRGIKRHPILFQCWASVEFDWTALNQHWAATLAQHWTGIGWVGLDCVYQVHRIDVYTDLSAVVVEEIGLHVEDVLVSLALSIIYILDI